MKIGNIEFRKPWVRYVDLELEEEIFYAVRKSIVEDIMKAEKVAGNYEIEFLKKYTRRPE